MRAGRPLYVRFRPGPGPSRREVAEGLAWLASLAGLAWLAAVAFGGWS